MRIVQWIYFLVLISFSATIDLPAQQPDSASPTGAEANAAYDAKDWAKSAALYEQITKTVPSPQSWYRLGVSLHKGGQNEAALDAFQKGMKAGLPAQFGEYGMAAVYSSEKDKEKAFEHLAKAAQSGYLDVDQLKTDSDLTPLRDDARFSAILAQTEKNQKPCAYAPENRQFDFWVGEWAVATTQGGTPAGDSKIELILGDCVVLENWTSKGSVGYSGKSYNIYNAALKRWEQYWVDNTGGNIFFYGGLKDGVMDYWTDELPQPDGTKLKRHLQFVKLDANTVRQLSLGSTDAGKSWNSEYDFTYRRKK